MTADSSNCFGLSPTELLKWISFTAVDRDRPGVFVSTFLFIKGWEEKDIGFVIFLKAIVALFAQPLMGDVIDRTHRKREYTVISNVIVSLTGISFLISLNYAWVVVALILQGIALTIIIPAIYSITLGTMGREVMHAQTALNEYYSHVGTAVYAVIAGLFSLYGYSGGIYYVVAIMGLACCVLVISIRPSAINDHGARGLTINGQGHHLPPKEYLEIFRDRRVMVLLMTILSFHAANAAMLPLLSQLQSQGDMRLGILITALNIVISQVVQALVSIWVGKKVKRLGSKALLSFALLILPVRGFIISVVLYVGRNNFSLFMLSFTQILDGISHGIYSVVHVLVAEALMHRTGRFSFLLGAAQTCHYVGDAVSNLFGEFMAGKYGYILAFQALTYLSFMPIILYTLLMPMDYELQVAPGLDKWTGVTPGSPSTAMTGQSFESNN